MRKKIDHIPESLAREEGVQDLPVLDVDFSGKEDPIGGETSAGCASHNGKRSEGFSPVLGQEDLLRGVDKARLRMRRRVEDLPRVFI